MFAGGEEVHRSPCVIRIENEGEEPPPVLQEPTATLDDKEKDELVEENEQENEAEERNLLPGISTVSLSWYYLIIILFLELPAAVTLSSLTKNRVTQKPFAKRRPPTRHHLIDQSNLTNNEDVP